MSIEDEILQRRHDLAVLENDTEDLIGDRRRAGIVERYEGDEDINSAPDDLDIAARQLGPATSLANKVGLREQKWQDLANIAPFARINPPSVLQGTIGGQQSVIPGGPSLQVANWGGSDSETLPVTITFAPVEVTPQFGAGTTPEFRPFGTVQFGTRGFLVKFEVDICRGCQFTLGASQVTLQVGLENTNNVNGSMKLAGMLSFYPVVRTEPITRTIPGIAGAGPGNATILLPMFAKKVVLLRDQAVGPITLSFINAPGLLLYTYTVNANNPAEPVFISNAVSAVVVSYAGLAASFELMFELDL